MAIQAIPNAWKEAAVWHFFDVDEMGAHVDGEIDPVAIFDRIRDTQYEDMASLFAASGLVLAQRFETVDPATVAIKMTQLARVFFETAEKQFGECGAFFVPLSDVNSWLRQVASQFETQPAQLLVEDDLHEAPN